MDNQKVICVQLAGTVAKMHGDRVNISGHGTSEALSVTSNNEEIGRFVASHVMGWWIGDAAPVLADNRAIRGMITARV